MIKMGDVVGVEGWEDLLDYFTLQGSFILSRDFLMCVH